MTTNAIRQWLNFVTPERLSCWDKRYRTNNACESLHSRLNKGIRGYPKFWSYPEKIKFVCVRFVMDFQRLQAGLRVSRVRPVTQVERAIRKYSEEFRQDGDIGRFIKRCRYLAFKSERVVEREAEEAEEEEEEEEQVQEQAVPQGVLDRPSTPVQPSTPQQPLNPSTPGTVPARRTRARRRLHTATQPAR